MTSTLTLLEVLVQPLKLERTDLSEKYEMILTSSPNIEIISLDIETSKVAANLRAKYNLKTPDAIQIAAGITSGADIFLTNDRNLSRVKEMKVMVLADEFK